jgi:hypothetical protein
MQVAVSLGSHGKRTRPFPGHLLEMIVVMMFGMCVLGTAFGAFHELALGSGFAAAWRADAPGDAGRHALPEGGVQRADHGQPRSRWFVHAR